MSPSPARSFCILPNTADNSAAHGPNRNIQERGGWGGKKGEEKEKKRKDKRSTQQADHAGLEANSLCQGERHTTTEENKYKKVGVGEGRKI